jgi:hypothetical protein
MPRPKKTWVAVVTATAIILGAAAILFAAIGGYAIYSHTAAQFVDTAAANAQFESRRLELAGQEPLIELRGVDSPVLHRRPDLPRREVVVLHVLTYDPRSRKLVRADIPGWLLRVVSAHGTIRLANLEMFADDRDRITLEDLERHGPGLIVDAPARSRVLVWTE